MHTTPIPTTSISPTTTITTATITTATESEVREILKSGDFLSWYHRFDEVVRGLSQMRAQRSDTATSTMIRIGDCEEWVEFHAVQFAKLEGSFDDLSDFEEQRRQASILWGELEAAQVELDRHRQELKETEFKTTLIQGKKPQERAFNENEIADLRIKRAHLNSEIKDWSAIEKQRKEKLEQAHARKDLLWEAIQESWQQAFYHSIASTEYAQLGKRLQMEMEKRGYWGSNDSEELEKNIYHLKIRQIELMEGARQRFGCMLLDSFCYWIDTEDPSYAFLVPLQDAQKITNIDLRALAVYKISRDQGLNFIAPTVSHYEKHEDDLRLTQFFMDRPSRPRTDSDKT